MRRALAIAVLLGHQIVAQSQPPLLSGVATDETGAVIPQARIVATSANGVAKSVNADNRGAWSIAGLIPGE